MYTNLSPHAKANEKDGTLSILVECDQKESTFIMRMNLAYFIDEFKHRMDIDEDKINYDFDEAYFDQYTDYKDTLDNIVQEFTGVGENDLQISLTPYRDPKGLRQGKTSLDFKTMYFFSKFGFIEDQDLTIDQVLFY